MVIFLNLSSFDIALDLDGPLSHLGFLFPSLRDNLAHSCAAAADDGDDFSRFYHSHPLSLFYLLSHGSQHERPHASSHGLSTSFAVAVSHFARRRSNRSNRRHRSPASANFFSVKPNRFCPSKHLQERLIETCFVIFSSCHRRCHNLLWRRNFAKCMFCVGQTNSDSLAF